MKLNNLLEDIKYLCEVVRKRGDKYFIYSHKTGKKLGKKEGYSSLRGAVNSMMIIASHGGFAKNPNKDKLVGDYIDRHHLKG